MNRATPRSSNWELVKFTNSEGNAEFGISFYGSKKTLKVFRLLELCLDVLEILRLFAIGAPL